MRFEPDWSPDRRRIAFVCESEIYTIRPDGSGTTRLTKNDVDEIDPAWRTRNRLTFAAAPDDEIHSVRSWRWPEAAHRERRERHVTVLVARRAPHRVRQRPP